MTTESETSALRELLDNTSHLTESAHALDRAANSIDLSELIVRVKAAIAHASSMLEAAEAAAVEVAREAARDRGYDWGADFADHNVPTIGKTYNGIECTAENIREIHASECWEAEENARQYSPFEFTAAEFNASDDSDALWEAFEEGTGKAITDAIAEFSDADYGIESGESDAIAELVKQHDALAERETDHHEISMCRCDVAMQWARLQEQSK